MKISKNSVIIALLCCVMPASWAYEARVVGISDGDTVTVLDANKAQHKIRVAGIDAPEKAQAFGNKSKEHLSDLIYGKSVSIPDSKIDKYGRTVSKIMLGTLDAGLEQIKAGMAWHYKKYETEQSATDRASYSAAEKYARAARQGLWSQGDAQRPEEFRHPQAISKSLGSGTECPCGENLFCTGSRGGQFCMTETGKKKYAAK